jgi:hypothetical protein
VICYRRTMRAISIVACLLAATACNTKIEKHEVSKLEFKTFTVAVPAGWQEVDNPEMKKTAGPNGHFLIQDNKDGGYTSNILIQDLADSGEAATTQHATLETCTGFQKGIVDQTKGVAGKVATVTFGSLHGCDIEVIKPDSPQATRQLAISDGKLFLSIVCNRDKRGKPDADAMCETFAKTITPKP